MQQYADIYSLQNYSICFGCHSTHHQEYQKLYPQPPVQVILLVTLLPSFVVWSGLVVRVKLLILLMMGAVTTETCRVVLQWINICILLHLLDFYSHWMSDSLTPFHKKHVVYLRPDNRLPFATLTDALRPLYLVMTQHFFRDVQDDSRFVMECCSMTITLSDDNSRCLKVYNWPRRLWGSRGIALLFL